ncbi:hypothetical protein TNIN_271151, partial [Trichonephila inaurata madagascariensis]
SISWARKALPTQLQKRDVTRVPDFPPSPGG